MSYFLVLLFSALLSFLITIITSHFAFRYNFVDTVSSAKERKRHGSPKALLGGIPLIVSFIIILIILATFTDLLWQEAILPKHILGIILASTIILLGGILDDIYQLRAKFSILFPIFAVLIIISFGMGVYYLTNPFGGLIYLGDYVFTLLKTPTLHFKIVLLSDLVTVIWLMGITYTTKLLDGVDGLVSGLAIIGSLIIFFMSLLGLSSIQPSTAYIAIIVAGVFMGFIFFNFYPAKIFLGEGGSLWAGFILGILAIISGSKIATALLIMGIPILDVIWIIIRRVFFEKKSPFSTADRKHLHFRFIDAGLTQRQTVLIYYFLAILFGGSALFLQSKGKLLAIVLLLLTMVIIGLSVVLSYKKKIAKNL